MNGTRNIFLKKMYKGKKILAIVPARGGSKGIKNKNLIKIKGKSLIKISADVLKKVKIIDTMILSSDNPSIIKEGKKSGLEVYFTRPKNISGDKIGDTPVILHAINFLEKKKLFFDVILLIQVTSPIRSVNNIVDCIHKLVDYNYDSVCTISKIDENYHPLKQFFIKDNQLKYYNIKGKKIIRRQDLEPTYIRNGICYSFTVNCIKKQKDKIGRNSSFILIKDNFVNIDTKEDVNKLKKILK